MKPAIALGVTTLALGLTALAPALTAVPALAQVTLFQAPNMVQAVSKNDLKTLRTLLQKGENPNVVDGQGRTPLIVAVNAGNREMVALLLDKGAHANRADQVGNTPLHWAAQEGDSDIIALLLAHSEVKVDQENKQGMTALMTAARFGQAGAVEALLQAGAKVGIADFTGRTALSWSEEGRNARVSTLLRRAGAQ